MHDGPARVRLWTALAAATILAMTAAAGFSAAPTAAAGAIGTLGVRLQHEPIGLVKDCEIAGVAQEQATLSPAWLPSGFTVLPHSAPSLPATARTVTATGSTSKSLQIHFSYSATPLNQFDGGATVTGTAEVDGEPAILEGPPPGPPGQFVDLYWKPNASDLLSIRGEGVPEATILDVARHLDFSPPKVIDLPSVARKVISSTTAIRRAQRTSGASRSTRDDPTSAMAKLTSWTEVTAMLVAIDDIYNTVVPARVEDAPWTPIWAVLVAPRVTTTRSDKARGTKKRRVHDDLVLVSAGKGTVLATVHLGRAASADDAWFTAITNRATSTGKCTRATGPEVPFGVLTRAEEARRARYTARRFEAPTRNGVAGVTSKLTTVVTLDEATGSALGCIEVDCSVPALLWTTIIVVRARKSGRTVACRLTDPIVGTGITRVAVYTRFDIPTSGELNCGPEPAWMTGLRSLVPPVRQTFTVPPHISGD